MSLWHQLLVSIAGGIAGGLAGVAGGYLVVSSWMGTHRAENRREILELLDALDMLTGFASGRDPAVRCKEALVLVSDSADRVSFDRREPGSSPELVMLNGDNSTISSQGQRLAVWKGRRIACEKIEDLARQTSGVDLFNSRNLIVRIDRLNHAEALSVGERFLRNFVDPDSLVLERWEERSQAYRSAARQAVEVEIGRVKSASEALLTTPGVGSPFWVYRWARDRKKRRSSRIWSKRASKLYKELFIDGDERQVWLQCLGIGLSDSEPMAIRDLLTSTGLASIGGVDVKLADLAPQLFVSASDHPSRNIWKP